MSTLVCESAGRMRGDIHAEAWFRAPHGLKDCIHQGGTALLHWLAIQDPAKSVDIA